MRQVPHDPESSDHMSTKVCLIKNASCAIRAEMAKAPLAERNQVAATCRKRQPVKRAPGYLVNVLPVALGATRKDQVQMAARLPNIAVVFTVGGPVVYERRSDQFA
jgi:hypothetical protein